MSFFSLSDGSNAQTDGTMDMGGGDIAPIPKNTNVLAAITESKIDEYQGERYINNAWTILQPAEYKNRKIFQKIRVFDEDTTKRDKAIRMLAAIDANCGGKLVKSGKEPTDQLLTQALINRPMVCNLQVWEIKEERDGTPLPKDEWKSGNWISKVAPRKQTGKEEEPVKTDVKAPDVSGIDPEEIPF